MRVAIVTGGTGALGQAVVVRLLAAPVVVAVPYAVESEAKALRARLAPDDDRLLLEPADVADADAMRRFVDGVIRRHGRVDILVAGVGGFAPGALVDTDPATWDRMLTLNLTSTFMAAHAVVPHMLVAGRGRVITVASRAVLPPSGGFIGYTVAKAGVIALTQALAEETRGRGVTVNAVLPSTMDTPANRAAMPDADRRGWVPVESVAETIVFLASDEASHITGSLLTV